MSSVVKGFDLRKSAARSFPMASDFGSGRGHTSARITCVTFSHRPIRPTPSYNVENEAYALMNTVPTILSSDTKRLTSELRRLVQRFQLEPAPDPATLQEFRHAVDNVRLAAWNVSELIHARQGDETSDTMVGFLAGERLRRFDQLAKNICADIERRAISFKTSGMTSLFHSVSILHDLLKQSLKEHQAQGSHTK